MTPIINRPHFNYPISAQNMTQVIGIDIVTLENCSRKFIPLIWFLLILLFLIAVLLWLPIRVEVDTAHEVYRASWQGLVSFCGKPGEENWGWQLRVLGWPISLKNEGVTPKSVLNQSKEKKPTRSKRNRFSFRQAMALFKYGFRAIQVKRLYINWDTGDYILNAWLYPLFRQLSGGQRQLLINFKGEQDITIRLQTRLGSLVLAALRVFINSKTK